MAMNIPPEVYATWPTPNYVDPVTRAPGLIITSSILGSLALATMVARAYSRLFVTKSFGIDDGLMILGLLLSIAASVFLGWAEFHGGLGRHIWDIAPTMYPTFVWTAWWGQLCIQLGLAAIKVSVLLFYRRLRRGLSRPFIIALWLGLTMNILGSFAYLILHLTTCLPVESVWKATDPTWAAQHSFKCRNIAVQNVFAGVFAVLGDTYATLLPIIMVSKLQLLKMQKWAVYGLFGTGFFIVLCTVLRLRLTIIIQWHTYDMPWLVWEAWLWTMLEVYSAIILACIPGIKPVLQRFILTPARGWINSYQEKRRTTHVTTQNSLTTNIEISGRVKSGAEKTPSNPWTRFLPWRTSRNPFRIGLNASSAQDDADPQLSSYVVTIHDSIPTNKDVSKQPAMISSETDLSLAGKPEVHSLSKS